MQLFFCCMNNRSRQTVASLHLLLNGLIWVLRFSGFLCVLIGRKATDEIIGKKCRWCLFFALTTSNIHARCAQTTVRLSLMHSLFYLQACFVGSSLVLPLPAVETDGCKLFFVFLAYLQAYTFSLHLTSYEAVKLCL